MFSDWLGGRAFFGVLTVPKPALKRLMPCLCKRANAVEITYLCRSGNALVVMALMLARQDAFKVVWRVVVSVVVSVVNLVPFGQWSVCCLPDFNMEVSIA